MTDATLTPGAPPAPPSTPAEAATQLAQLKADPNFVKPFLAGGPSQLKQFKDLHELIDCGDNYDLAIAGQLAPGEVQSSDHLQNIGAASMLTGVRPEIVRDVLAGTHTVTAEEYAKVKQFKADRMTDKDWSARLLAGDSEAKREFHLMNIILSGDIRAA